VIQNGHAGGSEAPETSGINVLPRKTKPGKQLNFKGVYVQVTGKGNLSP
jgi:hypothetical protein